MLYIHGGGLYYGSSIENPPEALTVTGDVISVSINYRLGVLGFLGSTDDNTAPGNVGLWDQVQFTLWQHLQLNPL